MRRVIKQSVVLGAPPDELYDSYLDSKRHSAITGGPVKIGKKPGSAFDAFDGMLAGAMLACVPKRLIVQSWRSSNFKPKDPDSTLILAFCADPKGGRIELVHLDVPPQDYDGVSKGWTQYYWRPWRKYLAKGN
jgi:activator of HSP90 ATPase